MEILSKKFYTVAIDLPGIGESKGSLNSYAKENIADYILELINVLNLKNIILVGCDAGGQIVYSCIKNFQEKLSGAIIMNVVIPGVSPWNTIKNNPYIWHFRFHLINDLPENLVSGREEIYFSYFYDILSSKNNIISDTYKSYFVQAYSNIDALKSGFDLYRTFNIDEENNIQTKNISVEIPVLYLRGKQENVDINLYLKGFMHAEFCVNPEDVISKINKITFSIDVEIHSENNVEDALKAKKIEDIYYSLYNFGKIEIEIENKEIIGKLEGSIFIFDLLSGNLKNKKLK